ncbi:MAG: AAA family ATPase [Sandaracinaceae bacterium]|nr:AAA family ATPase [Sandaracinaceae bacterium]
MRPPPYLRGARLVPERVDDPERFPFDLPMARHLDLELGSPVTFFVGENGSGKSTLIEALAELCGLPPSGGGKNELTDRTGPDDHSPLARALRPSFARRPPDGYFFRAEHMAHFADLLDERRDDPDFAGDPYARYGGRSLHTRSHGEAFLHLFTDRLEQGLFLMDEPESALSPQRQLALLVRMADLVADGETQLLVATHSPILLTFPGAEILSLDDGPPTPVRLEETSHYQITRGILESPERFWKHLRGARAPGRAR